MKRHVSSKSDNCTEGVVVYAVVINVKFGAHYSERMEARIRLRYRGTGGKRAGKRRIQTLTCVLAEGNPH
jgi:hypothetical protein